MQAHREEDVGVGLVVAAGPVAVDSVPGSYGVPHLALGAGALAGGVQGAAGRRDDGVGDAAPPAGVADHDAQPGKVLVPVSDTAAERRPFDDHQVGTVDVLVDAL